MNIYVDADIVAAWEKGQFDLARWSEEERPDGTLCFSATAWQQLLYGVFAWEPARAAKRARTLAELNLPVMPFQKRHAERAASLAAELKRETIGFADYQIASVVLLDEEAELLTFNVEHFSRVPGLRLARP